MADVKKYKPKTENIIKLEVFLKKIENGRKKDKRINPEGQQPTKH